MPDIGPPRHALGPARVVIILPYLVIYEHQENVVTVLRVLHGKRNITRDLLR
jgi:plasmid stabilization system protein ParE